MTTTEPSSPPDPDGSLPASVTRTVPVAWYGRSVQDPASLRFQLVNCQRVLPDGFVIAAHFYDVGSGLVLPHDLDDPTAEELALAAIPRDGGIASLLAEATQPAPRFAAVICETIDRLSRSGAIAAWIEDQLRRAGIPLFVADESIDPLDVKSAIQTATPNLTAIANGHSCRPGSTPTGPNPAEAPPSTPQARVRHEGHNRDLG